MLPGVGDKPDGHSSQEAGATQDREVTSNHDHQFAPENSSARNVRGADWRPDTSSPDSPPSGEIQHRGGVVDFGRSNVAEVHQEDSQDPLISLASVPGSATKVYSRREIHQGPLPPASELARYNEVDSTFAERIMSMAEQEIAMRDYAVRQTVDAEVFVQKSSPFVAVSVLVTLALSAYVLHATGAPALAVGLIGAAGPILMGAAWIISAIHGQEPPRQDRIDDDSESG